MCCFAYFSHFQLQYCLRSLYLYYTVNIVNNDQVHIDFKPLYQCLHIYEELGKRNEFKSNYEEDRRVINFM
jgi:hypothetical protein